MFEKIEEMKTVRPWECILRNEDSENEWRGFSLRKASFKSARLVPDSTIFSQKESEETKWLERQKGSKRSLAACDILWPWGLDYASTKGHIPFQVQWLAWRKIWKTTGKGPRVSSLVWFGSLGHQGYALSMEKHLNISLSLVEPMSWTSQLNLESKVLRWAWCRRLDAHQWQPKTERSIGILGTFTK